MCWRCLAAVIGCDTRTCGSGLSAYWSLSRSSGRSAAMPGGLPWIWDDFWTGRSGRSGRCSIVRPRQCVNIAPRPVYCMPSPCVGLASPVCLKIQPMTSIKERRARTPPGILRRRGTRATARTSAAHLPSGPMALKVPMLTIRAATGARSRPTAARRLPSGTLSRTSIWAS